MNNQYRIKLEIKLKEVQQGLNEKDYKLIIKVLKKDNRFNIKSDLTKNGNYSALTFIASNGFSIISNNQEYKGSLDNFSFVIPNKKFLNRNIEIGFMSDYLRKTYLYHLHKALIEWSSKWSVYSRESKPKFKTIGNKWYIYTCN